MGLTFSQQEESLTNEDHKKKLRRLEREMHRSLECTKGKLYISALNDECLPIVCAVDKFHGFLVNLSERDVTEEEIKKILERHLTTKYLKGLISHIKSVLTSMLNAEQSPEPTERVHVVLANKRVLRIDYFVHLEIDDPLKVLFYYVQVGVLDIARARLPVLQYQVALAMEDDQLEDALAQLNRMASSKLDEAIYSYYMEFQKIQEKPRYKETIIAVACPRPPPDLQG